MSENLFVGEYTLVDPIRLIRMCTDTFAGSLPPAAAHRLR